MGIDCESTEIVQIGLYNDNYIHGLSEYVYAAFHTGPDPLAKPDPTLPPLPLGPERLTPTVQDPILPTPKKRNGRRRIILGCVLLLVVVALGVLTHFGIPQNVIGYWYYERIIVKQDYAKALKWNSKGAVHRNRDAQQLVGHIYKEGLGVEQDDKEAAKWFLLAAEQGDVYSQIMLGSMYYYGEGVNQDNEEAAKWYRMAAEQGYAVAQNSLGHMYQNGYGVEQSDEEAEKWYRMAAEQNDDTVKN